MPKGRRKKKNGGGAASKTAKVEPTAWDAPDATNESPQFNSPVGITFYSYRVRETDTDGVSGKAAIDGLVHCGVLRGDTRKEIAWVHFPAVKKVKNFSQEKTVIVIEEI